MAKTPHEVATKLAAFYRKFPKRWIRGRMGDMTHGCCLMGGVLEIAANSTSSVGEFSHTFRRVTGWGVTPFNDCHAQNVNDIVAALDKVAAATKPPKEISYAHA